MSLKVVSVPIGNPKDITLRALESLKAAELLICEEERPAQTLFKKQGLPFPQEVKLLNEHSKAQDILNLVKDCETKNAVLISDCGTPGFCDPGADLVAACIKKNIPVDVNPGASSLMSLIALSGEKLNTFYFAGFLPVESEARQKRILELSKIKDPIILMDTPYRLEKLLSELTPVFGKRGGILGLDLTGQDHKVAKGSLKDLSAKKWGKTPFVLLITA